MPLSVFYIKVESLNLRKTSEIPSFRRDYLFNATLNYAISNVLQKLKS